jgi:hypothetical protein
MTTVVVLSFLVAPAVSDDGSGDRAALMQERIAAGDLEYRDPRTGEVVVATEERVAELRSELAPQLDWPAGARVEVADDATVSADIIGAMRDVFIARTRIDGTRERVLQGSRRGRCRHRRSRRRSIGAQCGAAPGRRGRLTRR